MPITISMKKFKMTELLNSQKHSKMQTEKQAAQNETAES